MVAVGVAPFTCSELVASQVVPFHITLCPESDAVGRLPELVLVAITQFPGVQVG